MKKILTNFLSRYVSNLFYLVGISIIIPSVIKYSVPNNIVFRSLPQPLLITVAIICVAIGFIGVYFRKGDLQKSFKTLGFLTIVPAMISAYLLIFGDYLLLGWAEKYKLTTLVDFSLRNVPQVWILTISYFVLALVWFWLGRRFR